MNARNLALTTAVGTVAVMALIFAYPAMASSITAPQNTNVQQLAHQQNKSVERVYLSVGQSIILTSVAGGYRQVGDAAANGTAAGSLTLRVTGSFAGGYALAVTGGTISLNGTTFNVSGGSAELGPYGVRMVGQGQAGSSAQFLFSARDLGKFGNTSYGVLRFDITSGPNEFGVKLLVTISA